MSIIISCPHCDKKYQAEEKHHGIETICTNCKQSFKISIPIQDKPIKENSISVDDAYKILYAFIDLVSIGSFKSIHSVDELPFAKERIINAYSTLQFHSVFGKMTPKEIESIKLMENIIGQLCRYHEITPKDLLLVRSINKKWGDLVLSLKNAKNAEEKLAILDNLNLTSAEQEVQSKYDRLFMGQMDKPPC